MDKTNNYRPNDPVRFKRNTQQNTGNVQASNRQTPKKPAKIIKKKRGLRIGGFVLRPRFIITLIVLVAVIVGIVALANSAKKPDCYELNRSSITIFEDADAIIIKNESGYSYPEGASLISRVKDGTAVEIGEAIAVIKTVDFNNDWYAQLDIARRNTINYVLSRVSDEQGILKNAIGVVDSQIERVSAEMVNTLPLEPQKYSEYSQKLNALYIERRSIAMNYLGADLSISEYLNKEEVIQTKINSCTQTIYALKTGIVSYNTDGYANLYNYNNIDAVTKTIFDNIIKDNYSTSIKNSRSSCDYYISDMGKSYIVMNGNGSTLKYLKANDETILRVNDGELQYIATVKTADHESDSSFVKLEPSGDFAPFYRTRVAEITVQKTWTGLVIPKEHIVKKKDQTGVYVYADGKTEFIPIVILAENDTVVVLDTSVIDNKFVQGMQIVKQ